MDIFENRESGDAIGEFKKVEEEKKQKEIENEKRKIERETKRQEKRRIEDEKKNPVKRRKPGNIDELNKIVKEERGNKRNTRSSKSQKRNDRIVIFHLIDNCGVCVCVVRV